MKNDSADSARVLLYIRLSLTVSNFIAFARIPLRWEFILLETGIEVVSYFSQSQNKNIHGDVVDYCASFLSFLEYDGLNEDLG